MIRTKSASYDTYYIEGKPVVKITQLSTDRGIVIDADDLVSLLKTGGEKYIQLNDGTIILVSYNLARQHLYSSPQYLNTYLNKRIEFLILMKDLKEIIESTYDGPWIDPENGESL